MMPIHTSVFYILVNLAVLAILYVVSEMHVTISSYSYNSHTLEFLSRALAIHMSVCVCVHTLECLSRALAIHMSCLSPTEKFSPFSRTGDSRPLGKPSIWKTHVHNHYQQTYSITVNANIKSQYQIDLMITALILGKGLPL